MRLLYTCLLYLAAPWVFAHLWLRGRRQPEYRRRIGERLGYVAPPRRPVAVWVHAVSVGESVAAFPLIEALIARHGEGAVWVTTTTPTGSTRIVARFGSRVCHSYVPYDWPGAVRRFLRRVQPQCAVIMETELWPNLFHALARQATPLIIGNARLSPHSFRGYARIRGAMARVLNDCTLIAAQSPADADRFRQLGASRVRSIGNLKFDLVVPAAQIAHGHALRAALGADRPVWVAASTHDDEEAAVLTAHARIRQHFGNAALILVPRHPQRFDAVSRLIHERHLSCVRRSQTADGTAIPAPGDLEQTTVLLGDTMGEMFTYLAAADVAFVGGSLAKIGGHNVLEPAALGLPVLFGPYMHNFEAARTLLTGCDAGHPISDAEELAQAICARFENPTLRQRMGRAAESAVANNRGALQRLLSIIDAHTGAPPTPATPTSAA
ncbi:MAG TPA: lipid IV(A) 3-deoxy-D-manno-octulosonic acid transferase [Nevskiaceae bacterium]|nr:lipid IV(A) 3-deoxy-D-manno-octulosonic acid transferase [Nevskiaceae bacterium]